MLEKPLTIGLVGHSLGRFKAGTSPRATLGAQVGARSGPGKPRVDVGHIGALFGPSPCDP
ncbi:MAG: hypothetical protein ACT4R6_10980 [Gemmatimonadaceae bacterium]